MNPVSSIPTVPTVQPAASHPIISAMTSVASGCSRFCGFTDLGQSISLIRQGEYVQAGGKALEGALRLGVLVAIACCFKELGRKDVQIDRLYDRLQKEEGLRNAEVLKVQQELNLARRSFYKCSSELADCKTEVKDTNGYLNTCDEKRATFQGSNVKLKKELTDLKIELETEKANKRLCESFRGWFASAPDIVIKNEGGVSINKKVEDELRAKLTKKEEEIQEMKDNLKDLRHEKDRCQEDLAPFIAAGRTSVPLLTSAELKTLYEKSLNSKNWNFNAKDFLCKDVPGEALDCTTKQEIKRAWTLAVKRCKVESFEGEDRKMASRIHQLILETRNDLTLKAAK